MKRQRKSWATRALPPLTVEEIERHLDLVAYLMEKARKDATRYLPIWRRVNLELAKQQEIEMILASARDRHSRNAAV